MPILSDKNIAISVKDLSKTYSRNSGGAKDEFFALKDINLDIYKGEVIGIIGPNGSGKSTLLKIMSEITAPSNGSVNIDGKVASILEVGTGFIPDLSGRKNIYLNARLHGMKKSEVDQKFDDIVEMFGFPDFLDTPVKQYSSGMYMRLAFAVVVHIEADIYLFDEVLSVGDSKFRNTAIEKLELLNKKSKTIVIVTHDYNTIIDFSSRFLLFNEGELLKFGEPDKVALHYSSMMTIDNNLVLCAHINSKEIEKNKIVVSLLNNTKKFVLTEVFIESDGVEKAEFLNNETLHIHMIFNTEYRDDIVIGIYLLDINNQTILTSFKQCISYETNKTYELITTIKKNFFNNITAKFGLVVILKDNLILNYQNLLKIKITPNENDSLISKVKGYIVSDFETKEFSIISD